MACKYTTSTADLGHCWILTYVACVLKLAAIVGLGDSSSACGKQGLAGQVPFCMYQNPVLGRLSLAPG